MKARKIVRWVVALWAATLMGSHHLVFAEAPKEQGADFGVAAAEGATQKEKPSFWSKLRVSGYMKHETAYRVREPRSITKMRNILYVNAQYPFTSNVKFNYTGWAYYDLAYDLFDYRTIAARPQRDSQQPLVFVENLEREKDSPVAATRELYFDVFLKNLDIRLGKQYVVWGVLEGVRIVDEVNPVDFRELILPDLLDYRISQWTLKMDHYRGDTTYQFLVIPDVQFHKSAPRGSEWELLQEIRDNFGTVLTRKPKSYKPENAAVGLRATSNIFNTEVSLSYLYTWDFFPTVFRTIRMDQQEDPILYPTYTRIAMYGGTAVKQIGPFILKGEAAYVTGKYFGLKNTVDRDNDGYLDSNGALKRDHIRWGMGLDFNIKGLDLSPGVTQWIILNHDPEFIQARNDSSFNLFGRKEFPQHSATAQFLWIYLINMKESYLKPKVTFQVTDKFQIGAGMDLFWGKKGFFGDPGSGISPIVAATQQRPQFLGYFHDNDRIFMDFKYSF